MGKHIPIDVGYKFKVKPSGEVTVVQYFDYYNVLVQDEEGNQRMVVAHDLKKGNIIWRYKDGRFKPGRTELRLAEDRLHVVERMREKFSVGSTWQSNKFGSFRIVEVIDANSVTIQWDTTNTVQRGVKTWQINDGHVRNEAADEPMPIPEGHYVYVVSVRGEVVYVGMGTGKRWLHASNGCSTNKELNRLYFSKEPVINEIYAQGLDRAAAAQLEKELIAKYTPKCNERVYKV